MRQETRRCSHQQHALKSRHFECDSVRTKALDLAASKNMKAVPLHSEHCIRVVEFVPPRLQASLIMSAALSTRHHDSIRHATKLYSFSRYGRFWCATFYRNDLLSRNCDCMISVGSCFARSPAFLLCHGSLLDVCICEILVSRGHSA